MNTMMRFALAAILAASAVPLTANAESFKGSGAFGYISGSSISSTNIVYVSIYAFQNASKDNSGKTNSHGADVRVNIYGINICYDGYGSTDNIQFTVTPSLNNLSVVNALGSVQVYLVNCSGGLDARDNISFNMNIAAAIDGFQESGKSNTRIEFPTMIRSVVEEHTLWNAVINGPTTITSNTFGPMIVTSDQLGQSKVYEREIIKK